MFQIFYGGKTIGYNMHLIDIGGGFPGHKGSSIEQHAAIINSSIRQLFPASNIKVIAEPGRFFASSSATLACMIHSKKTVTIRNPQNGEDMLHNMYYINDGVHGSFSIFGLYNLKKIPVTLRGCQEHQLSINCTIYGPTCDGHDKVI